ncbi:MAG: carotenoid oxygenase family protein [Chloroflexi bacterium]|nr:carotenoid oxygenase family protein [Chloroflexota bacterium]OJV88913.1 MAG: hypothetical protein BGO39_02740 [Chloroflexi bacterium 54-19]
MTTEIKPQNIFQAGFTSLNHETSLENLPVIGAIPEWLAGSLYRNGPAKFEAAGGEYKHWFDGFAMLHRFSFNNSQVSYRNRFLLTPVYREALETGRLSPAFSGVKLAPGVEAGPPNKNAYFNPDVNIMVAGGRYLALTEIPVALEFGSEELNTLNAFNYDGLLDCQVFGAHPHYDFNEKRIYNLGVKFGRQSYYQFYAFDAGRARPRKVAEVPVAEPAYLHSFAMTENYLIIVEFPLVVNPVDLLTSGKPFIENYRWEPQRATNFIVVSKATGQVVNNYQAEAFFAFHQVNAFEKGSEIIVDLPATGQFTADQSLLLDNLKAQTTGNPDPARFRRYRLSMQQNQTEFEILNPLLAEMPAINYRHYNAREYRYAYAVSNNRSQPEGFENQLIKLDVYSRELRIWREAGCYPGEPVFVASPQSVSEDDGVLLTVILDGKSGKSFLLVLDAATFEELGRAYLPHHIPFGLHGIFTA